MRLSLSSTLSVAADFGDWDAERGGAIAVDHDVGARQVEGERVLDDEELAALHRLLLDLFGDLVDLIGVADRADHVLHGQAAGAGQRRRAEDQSLDARDLRQAALDLLLDFGGGAVAFAPRFEAPDRDAAVARRRAAAAAEADDGELADRFRHGADGFVELVDVVRGVFGGRVARGGDEGEERALVFGRREFRRACSGT